MDSREERNRNALQGARQRQESCRTHRGGDHRQLGPRVCHLEDIRVGGPERIPMGRFVCRPRNAPITPHERGRVFQYVL